MRLLRPTLLVVVLCSACVAPPLEPPRVEAITQIVEKHLSRSKAPGLVIGVIEGKKQSVLGFGRVSLKSEEKPGGATVYEIGSITKAFTGTLLADMVNKGEIKLEAPLQDFVPAGVKLHSAKDQPIKLVDLASQSSGLPRMPYNMGPKDIKNPYADYTSELMFEFLSKYELKRPPGEYEYSNFGMGLLGTILARKAGKPYEELIVDRICGPLKMTDTRIKLSDGARKRFSAP